MNTIQLYDYQVEMKQRIETAFKEYQSIMVQMPTGTGKTHLLASVVNSYVQKSTRNIVWIIAHRRELVSQIERTISLFGMEVNHKKPETCQVRVYSIQWLSKHLDDVKGKPALIIVDEAHHALAKTYSSTLDAYPKAKKMGLTATPCRLNGNGFTDLFDTLLTAQPINDFIKAGYLAPFDYVSIPSESEEVHKIDAMVKRGADGDYSVNEMSEVLDTRPSIERLYKTLKEFADGKKGIVYAIDIAHATHIAEYYQSKGLRAEVVTSKTKEAERDKLVNGFSEGLLDILIGVDIFSEGFDCPDVEFIQMARPTLSLAKYQQQVGRGLRIHKDKKYCMILDNVGLYRLFGSPANDRNWQAMFEGREKGKGEEIAQRGAYMRMMESYKSLSFSSDNDTEMVVLARHDELQERIELGKILKTMVLRDGFVKQFKLGWKVANNYIRKGTQFQVFKYIESRKFGYELLKSNLGTYYTLNEKTEELIRVGSNDPWSEHVSQAVKRNPSFRNDKVPCKLSMAKGEYLWPPEYLSENDVLVFKDTSFLQKGEEVLSGAYKILKPVKLGLRVFRDSLGFYGIMNQDGSYYLMWDKEFVDLKEDGIAMVLDKRDDKLKYVNVYTMQEFTEKPEVIKCGFVELLKINEQYFVQKARAVTGIPLRMSQIEHNDSVFLFLDYYVILKKSPRKVYYISERIIGNDREYKYKLIDVRNGEVEFISGNRLPIKPIF